MTDIDPAVIRHYYEQTEYITDAEHHAVEEKPARLAVLRNFLRGHERLVLEIGCGSGVMGDIHPQYLGLDVSEEAVNLTRQRGYNATRWDCTQPFPLESESVDAVFSFNTIEHILDPVPLFTEIDRVLAPGGVVLIKASWNIARNGTPVWRRAINRIRRVMRRICRSMSGRTRTLVFNRIEPDYSKIGKDFDAVASVDHFLVFEWFRWRGYRLLNATQNPILRCFRVTDSLHDWLAVQKG